MRYEIYVSIFWDKKRQVYEYLAFLLLLKRHQLMGLRLIIIKYH